MDLFLFVLAEQAVIIHNGTTEGKERESHGSAMVCMYFQHFIHSELVQARQALLDLIVVALIIALIQCSHLHQPITSTSPSHRLQSQIIINLKATTH
jgi:hypothetical protein